MGAARRYLFALPVLLVADPMSRLGAQGTAAIPLAIEHVSVIPMDRERVISDQTIIVRNGKIESMGPARAVRVPADAMRIDGTGRFAIPGIADMHVHPYDTYGFPSYLRYGVTTIAALHGSPEMLRWRTALTRGTLEGPSLYVASPSVNGFPPGNSLFIAVQDTGTARIVAREQKAAGYDFIKAYSFLNADVYRALLDEATRIGIPVLGHIPVQVGVDGVLRAGQSNVAHIEEFFQTGDVPDDSMPALARRVKASGITVTANVFAYSDYLRTIADINGVLSDSEMRFASPAQYSEKLPTSNRATNRPNLSGFARFLTDRRIRFQKLLRAFSAAGVPILVGTDTEIFGFPGQSAYLELLELVEAGLTPFEALVAGTRNAGDFVAARVRGSDRFGMIAPGMRADIVLLSANPLTDIRRVSAVSSVVVRGRWYSPERIERMRDSVATATASERRFVYEFDSLIMRAKDGPRAATALLDFMRDHRDAPPLAELVWTTYGRVLFTSDRANAVTIRAAMPDGYPESSWASQNLARALALTGDTARAIAELARAVRLTPTNFSAVDALAKLVAARGHTRIAAPVTYDFESFAPTVQGQPTAVRLTVTLSPTPDGNVAQIVLNGDSTVRASELILGEEQRWVTVPFAGQSLELRFWERDGVVLGTWVLGFVNNGTLKGQPPRRPPRPPER